MYDDNCCPNHCYYSHCGFISLLLHLQPGEVMKYADVSVHQSKLSKRCQHCICSIEKADDDANQFDFMFVCPVF